MNTLNINGERLWQALMDYWRDRGHPKGGNAPTGADCAGRPGPRPALVRWMREAGLAVTVDQAGNLRPPRVTTRCRRS